MLAEPALSWRASIGGNLSGLRADLEKEAPLVRWLSPTDVFDFDRVRRNTPLVVVNFDLDLVGASHLGASGQPTSDSQASQSGFAHDTRYYDEREEQTQEQVEQVIGCVYRSDANAEGNPQKVLTFPRDSKLPWKAPSAKEFGQVLNPTSMGGFGGRYRAIGHGASST
jgi:hypothetical protein